MEKENMSLKVKVETIGCQSVDQKKKNNRLSEKNLCVKKRLLEKSNQCTWSKNKKIHLSISR